MKNITAKTVEEFEVARKSSVCNMADWPCVQRYANANKLYSLACLTSTEYSYLITNYQYMLDKFNITQ